MDDGAPLRRAARGLTVGQKRIVGRVDVGRCWSRRAVARGNALVDQQHFEGPGWKRRQRGVTAEIVEVHMRNEKKLLQPAHRLDILPVADTVELDNKLI